MCFFKIRLWIGRIERCFKCGKRIWNRNESLYDSLYHERNGGQTEIGHIECVRD